MFKDRPHKVLGISTDYAFCLHSATRAPYHIVLKVAFTENTFREDEQDNNSRGSYEASVELNDDVDLGPEKTSIEM